MLLNNHVIFKAFTLLMINIQWGIMQYIIRNDPEFNFYGMHAYIKFLRIMMIYFIYATMLELYRAWKKSKEEIS